MSKDDQTIAPLSVIIEFGLLVGALIIMPASTMYFELFNTEIRNAKIDQFGLNWVLGSLIFSIVALTIGFYIFVRKIIFAYLKLRKLQK